MAQPPMTEAQARAYADLVHHIARQAWGPRNTPHWRGRTYEDIEQEAWEGFLEAWEKFDPQYGVRVTTFCSYRAYGKIADRFRKDDPLPQRSRQQWREVEAICAQLRQRRGHEPTFGEMAQALGVSTDELDTLRQQAAAQEVPLDASPEPARLPDQETSMDQRALAEAVSACVHALKPCLYKVVLLRYSAEPPLTLEAVGKALGYTSPAAARSATERRLKRVYACLQQCLKKRRPLEFLDDVTSDDITAVAKLLHLGVADRRGAL